MTLSKISKCFLIPLCNNPAPTLYPVSYYGYIWQNYNFTTWILTLIQSRSFSIFTLYYSQYTSSLPYFHHTRMSHIKPFDSFPCLNPPTPLSFSNLFSKSIILSYKEYYINRFMQYIIFWDKHFSLRLIPMRSIQDMHMSVASSFLLLSSIPKYGYIRIYLAILSLKYI